MSEQKKSPYRLAHMEHQQGVIDLKFLSPGDVFVREGTPCMLLHTHAPVEEGKIMIANLTNGSAWAVSPSEQVWPATNVMLTFETARRL